MVLDLNHTPAMEEVRPTVKQEVPVKEEMVEEVRKRADVPFIRTWETLTPIEYAALNNMVEVPVNYRRVHRFVTHRANGNSEHAWISWFPAHHATLGGTVIHSSGWKTVPIIHGTAPPLAAPALASRAPGLVAPDVLITSPFLSMKEGQRSAVRLVELGSSSEDGTNHGVPITVSSMPTQHRCVQNPYTEYIGSSSQQGAENHEAEDIGASPPTPSAAASFPVEQLPTIQIEESFPRAAKRNRRSTWGQHVNFRRAHQQTWTTKAAARYPPATTHYPAPASARYPPAGTRYPPAAARYPPAATVVPPASSSHQACNTSPGVWANQISPSLATVLSAFTRIRQTLTPSVPACSVSPSALKKWPMPSDTMSAPAGSFKFKLFNVEIDIAAEKAAAGHGGHGGHGNVEGNINPTGAQNINGVEAGDDLYTPPVVTEGNQFNKLVLPRKRRNTTAEWSPYRMSW